MQNNYTDSNTRPSAPVSSGLPTSIRAVIVAISFWVLSLSLTVVSGSVAAFVGCLLACFLVERYLHSAAVSRLRNHTLVLCAAILAFCGVGLANALVNTNLLPSVTSGMWSYHSAEAVKWFTLAIAIAGTMRALARRSSYGSILEILFVACAFVITLAAHRNGMIHRPFFLGDFALIRGIDPSSILLVIGCGAVLSMATLLLAENNLRRLPYHFTILGLLCFSLLGYVQLFGIPTPSMTDDLGLTGREGGSGQQQNENPFKDQENDADSKQAPVAVVLFRDDYQPQNGTYYFRESAYSRFNGSLLDFAQRPDMDQDLIKNFTNARIETDQQVPDVANRQLVRTTIGTLVSHRTPFGLDSPVAYEHTANPNNLRFKRTYDAYSVVPDHSFDDLIGRELGREDWSAEVWQEYLTLPDDPRYAEMANRLIADLKPEYAEDPFAKALIVKSFLDDNGIYSLKNEHAYESDPAGSFLFGDLTGYCMHFSFAATHLYRSLGIPARVGIGYAVPEENRAGGSSLLIQAIHGHAWPEIYLRDVGWVIVDPAPQQTLVDMTTDPQNDLQQLLGDMLRDEASFDEFLADQQSSLIPWQTVLNTLYLLAAALLALAYLIKLYRLWIPRYAGIDDLHRLSYRAILDRFAALGMRRKFGESRENFAKRLAEFSPTFSEMTGLHLQQSLGFSAQSQQTASPQHARTARLQQWQSMQNKINDDIARGTPTWRRWLAWANPLPWLLTK